MLVKPFMEKYLSKQVEYHSYSSNSKYQCVDLANQFIVEVLRLNPVIGTNAKDFPSKINKEQFEVIKNTPDFVPREGDIAVWNGNVGGGAGHIAIVRDNESTVSVLKTLDQNWSRPLYVTIENHNFNNVSYFLRPKETNMTDDALSSCLEDRKKFWRERDEAVAELAKANEDLAKLNERISQERKSHKQELDNLNESHEKALETQKNELSQQCDTQIQTAKAKLIKQNEELKAQIVTLQKEVPASKDDIIKRYTSRKFIAPLLVLISYLALKFFGVEVNVTELLAVITPVLAFIGAEGWTDYKERINI